MVVFFIPIIGFIFFLSSCSPIQFAPESGTDSSITNFIGGETRGRSPSSRRRRGISSHKVEDKWDCGGVPSDSNVYVDHWIHHFSEGEGRYTMSVHLERSTKYMPLIQKMLRENGFPEDMIYVAMVESGFNPKAISKDDARGTWQFMEGTAGDYKLRINEFVDERFDVVLSTKAAMKYLEDLCKIFEDWYLAVSGYNAGQDRINKISFNTKERDFWRLVDMSRSGALQINRVPEETQDYIPKIIAYKEIAENPMKYDFYNLKYQEPLDLQSFRIRKPSRLSRIAEKLNIPLSVLKENNPMYLTDKVPVNDDFAYIRVPRKFL